MIALADAIDQKSIALGVTKRMRTFPACDRNTSNGVVRHRAAERLEKRPACARRIRSEPAIRSARVRRVRASAKCFFELRARGLIDQPTHEVIKPTRHSSSIRRNRLAWPWQLEGG